MVWVSLSLSLQLVLRFLAIIVTACVSNPWILIPAAVIMICFILLRTYYLKTSRDIKRLEAVGQSHPPSFPPSLPPSLSLSLSVACSHSWSPCTARSPLYSHISTTLQGLPTIRSFHQEEASLQYLYR